MITAITLHTFSVQGNNFLRADNGDITTTFVVKTIASRKKITFPERDDNFFAEKKEYTKKYGPYSITEFESIMKEFFNNFERSTKLQRTRRIIRKVWILRQMYKLFDVSMGILVFGMPNLLVHAIIKALEVLEDPAIEMIMEDDRQRERTKRMITSSLEVIRTVYMKIVKIATSDVELLKLLPMKTLLSLVDYASQPMVSKIRRLPWVEPGLVDKITPKYNCYWQTFWHEVFKRILNFDNDICFMIAQFMPMNIRKETFLEFFQRNYFSDKQLFNVSQVNNFITVTLK